MKNLERYMTNIKMYLELTFDTKVRKVATKTSKGVWDSYYFVYKDSDLGVHNVSITHYTKTNHLSIEVKTNRKLGTKSFYKTPRYQTIGYGYQNINAIKYVLPSLIRKFILNRGENHG